MPKNVSVAISILFYVLALFFLNGGYYYFFIQTPPSYFWGGLSVVSAILAATILRKGVLWFVDTLYDWKQFGGK